MKIKDFERAINAVRNLEKLVDSLNDLGIDIIESTFLEYGILADLTWLSNYGEEGTDLINWWLYEKADPIIYTPDGDAVSISTIQELHEYLEKNYV